VTRRHAALRHDPVTGRAGRGPADLVDDFGGLAVVAEERLAAVLAPRPDPIRFPTVQTREGEFRRTASIFQQFRAIYSSQWFWQVVDVFPRNAVPEGIPGRRQSFPDYLLALVVVCGGVKGLGTTSAALRQLSDPHLWAQFISDLERFVPEGWTRVSELNPDQRAWDRALSCRVTASASKPEGTLALKPVRHASPTPATLPPVPWPSPDHVRYFEAKVRGHRKQDNRWVPTQAGDEYYMILARLNIAFERASIEQVQAMGLAGAHESFHFQRPWPGQYLLADGTVFGLKHLRSLKNVTSCEEHSVGGQTRTVYGTKFDIISTRVPLQPQSRVILAVAHVGHDPLSHSSSEARTTVDLALRLRDLSGGGIKGVICDSAVRGAQVTELQRAGLVCVNYPHALSNPEGGAGHRLAPGRVDKNHLAKVITHETNGQPCHHFLYWLGGLLIEKYQTFDGTWDVRAVQVTGYKKHLNRGASNATCREYLRIEINCTFAGSITARVPLFHLDGTDDSLAHNFGEVVRVFAPSSPEFLGLYPSRNDTEARHSDLKQRIKYMPRDVAGQHLKVLAASLAVNALSWQFHLQAHHEANVFNNTA